MPRRPYTIIDAYREEINHWDGVVNKSLLMAFTFCLKLRLDGSSFDEQFPSTTAPDYRAD